MRASRARRAGDVNQFVGAGRSEVPGPYLGQPRTCVHAYGASQDGHKRPIEPTGCPPKEPLPGVPGGPRERTMTTTPPRSSARAFALGSVATPSPAAALAPARPQAALGPTPWRKQLEVPARPRADTTPCGGPCGTTLVHRAAGKLASPAVSRPRQARAGSAQVPPAGCQPRPDGPSVIRMAVLNCRHGEEAEHPWVRSSL